MALGTPTDARSAQLPTGEDVSDDIADEIDLEGLGWDESLRAASILVGSIVVAVVAQRIVRALVRRTGNEGVARFAGRFTAATIVGIGVIYALSALGVRLGPLLGILGVGGIALAFALQDLVENVISGVMLQTKRQFAIGDQVVSNGFEGTIEDINFRSTLLRTFDNRLVVLPNSVVYKNPLENHTAYPLRRTTLAVGVDYETDLVEAREVMLAAARSAPDVATEPEPTVWVEAFGESSIDLAVMFWHEPSIATEWQVRNDVAVRTKRALDDADITIPFPQRVLHVPGPLPAPDGDDGRGPDDRPS